MVKNTSGGTKTKGVARKHQVGAAGGGGPLRIPNNPLEQLVVVTKMLGNGMCEVFNNDDVRFIAHIRNKFKGRNRRSNDISVNSFILVGLREWEKPAKNADVIFVYDINDYHALQSIPYLHSHKLFDRIYSNHNINLLNHLVDFTIDSNLSNSNNSNFTNFTNNSNLPFDLNINDI
jgi:translation initiation factor IF-1